MKTNISLPPSLSEELRRLLDRAGAKRHWTVHSASVLLLLELSEGELDHYMAAAGAADFSQGSYADLIARARSGELRAEAERKAELLKRIKSPGGLNREDAREAEPAERVKGKGKRKTG